MDSMYYYAGSKVAGLMSNTNSCRSTDDGLWSQVVVEWTNQHGCGANPKTSCEVVIQYACEDTMDPSGIPHDSPAARSNHSCWPPLCERDTMRE